MSPTLSVVVASAAEGPYLERCLASLAQQAPAAGAEVLVVDRTGRADALRAAHAFAEVVEAPPGPSGRPLSVPELRALGVERARGEVVCIVEEHCAAHPDWLAVVAASWRPGDAAIGGPVAPDAYDRARDWAVYLSEFHNYLPPWPPGERLALNGVNVAYSRALLLAERAALGAGYWEVAVHPRLAARGAFRSVPEMLVSHAGPFDFRLYLEQRYLLSRVWGAGQRAAAPLAKRAVYLAAAPLFPPLLLLRIAARARAAGLAGRFARALPHLVPISCAYVLGEWMGYAFGMGDALERVE